MSLSNGKQATLNDVALHSGVSYQTVSRVVNNHPHVAKETRARVLSAIQKLGYRPNRAARSLVTRRSSTIGVVSFGTTYYGPAQMVTNIEGAVKARGYSLTPVTIAELTLEALQSAVQELRSRSVDGIIMITPVLDLNLAHISGLCADIPFVMIDITLGAAVPSVVIDQRHGAKLATQHLIGLGHRRIGEISGPLNWCDAKLRHEGWLATLHEAGLKPGPSVESDWTAAGGYEAAHRLLEAGFELSALVIGNDQMALGAMRALREHGLRVPEDVSVVGFDDVPEAAYFEPPLTTVRQDFRVLGKRSIDYLIRLIDKPDLPPHQSVLQPVLVERSSTRRWEVTP